MKTPPADLTARLLDSAPQLLGHRGVPRFEEVATQVGVSRATLYYYFSGQDDLLAFLLQAHVEEGAAAMAVADPGDGSAAERLDAVLSAIADYLGDRPTVCSGLLSAAAAGEGFEDVLALNDTRIAQPLRELLASGIEDGSLEASDVADAANVLLGAIAMAVLGRSATGRDPATSEFHQALVAQLVRGISRS